jgi:hypothetical protein
MGGDHQPAAQLSRGLLHLFYCDAHSSEFQLKAGKGILLLYLLLYSLKCTATKQVQTHSD